MPPRGRPVWRGGVSPDVANEPKSDGRVRVRDGVNGRQKSSAGPPEPDVMRLKPSGKKAVELLGRVPFRYVNVILK